MIGRRAKNLLDAGLGAVAVGLLRAIKRMDRRRAADLAGGLLRKVGPHLKEHRIGRDNLRAAFPDKSEAEIERILQGVWDNLGRVAAEFVHLDEFHIGAADDPNAIVIEPAALDRSRRLIGGHASVSFCCHTANWEMSAVAAKLLGADPAVLYRRPNIRAVSDAVIKLRAGVTGRMIPSGFDAPVRLAHLLQEGVHVGMLVDQHYTKGVDVTFFGRRCKANPLIAHLARQLECPIYGLRIIRLADRNRFAADITEPVVPPRNAKGRIDVQATMQIITSVIEGWVRECPDQWLWLHRRWR